MPGPPIPGMTIAIINMKYFKLFTDQIETFNALEDGDAGKLIKAIFQYANGETPELSGPLKAIFLLFKGQIDRSLENYDLIVERNRENGKHGGRPKKPTRLLENPEKPSGIKNNPEEPKKSQDKDKDKDKQSAIDEILSLKRKARMWLGKLYVGETLINDPVAYLAVIKKNSPAVIEDKLINGGNFHYPTAQELEATP